MPTTYSPSQLHAMVQDLLADNVNNEISAADARAVLDAVIDSFYNLVVTPNPTAPSLENVLAQGNESGPRDIIMYTGKYMMFRGAGTSGVRIRPLAQVAGDPVVEVNLPVKDGTLALLSDIARSSWLLPVAEERNEPIGSEPNGTRLLVGTSPSGAFAGKAGQVAKRVAGAWQFDPTANGDVVRCAADTPGTMRMKVAGVWMAAGGGGGDLHAALVAGNTTGGKDVVVSTGDAVAWRNNGFLMRLQGNDIAMDHTVLMPDADGTLATVQQVAQLLSSIDLHTVLVNGNETNGRSITVSEGDGINYKAGTKQVRVKAPATLAADRNVQWPDKSGTVATTDDVAGRLKVLDNLSDVADPTAARGNLGLRQLALEDYADALIMKDMVIAGDGELKRGDVALINGSGMAVFATPALAAARKVMVVVETADSHVRLQMSGVCSVFTGLTVGEAYYLDPASPGRITSTRPSMHAVYVGVAIDAKTIILSPDMPLPSGSVVLAEDVYTNEAGGVGTLLLTPVLEPGLYDVIVQASVRTTTGAGRGVLWLALDAAGSARGMTAVAEDDREATVYTDVDLSTKSAAIHDVGDGGVTEQSIRALVQIVSKTGITVWVAPRVGGYDTRLLAGSVMTWNRIG